MLQINNNNNSLKNNKKKVHTNCQLELHGYSFMMFTSYAYLLRFTAPARSCCCDFLPPFGCDLLGLLLDFLGAFSSLGLTVSAFCCSRIKKNLDNFTYIYHHKLEKNGQFCGKQNMRVIEVMSNIGWFNFLFFLDQ